MDISFYTAKTGAKAQQTSLDVISNNVANVNTAGYKAQRAGFVDLLYSNVRDPEGVDTQLQVGSGARIEKTDIDFNTSGLQSTDSLTDYAIVGSGFFAVQNPATNEIYYTRDGSFRHSLRQDGNFYLVTGKGDLVLDRNFQRIQVDLEGGEEAAAPERLGVFDFNVKDGMLLAGDNLFSPVAKNGQPFLVEEDGTVQQGYLEMSNADTSKEMTRLIEAQRAYSMTLKMVQTSNEIEQTIEGLRG